MDQQFKVNDWVFCEFTLKQIRQVEGGRVTEVSDGISSLASYSLNDRCCPLTMQNKLISDEVKNYYRQIVAANALNPHNYRELVKWWLQLISLQDQPEELYSGYRTLSYYCSRQIASKRKSK